MMSSILQLLHVLWYNISNITHVIGLFYCDYLVASFACNIASSLQFVLFCNSFTSVDRFTKRKQCKYKRETSS